MEDRTQIAVLGLGYVGCVTAACFSKLGHTVIGVDPDEFKVRSVNDGAAPFYEPGLEEIVKESRAAGRLSATTSIADGLRDADVAMICVGTPSERNGNLSLSTLRLVAEHADLWHGFTTVETYPDEAEVLDRHCAAVGRDPATIVHSAGVEDNSGVRRGEGTEALLANAGALADLGVTLLTIGVNGPDYDLAGAQALCRWRDGR